MEPVIEARRRLPRQTPVRDDAPVLPDGRYDAFVVWAEQTDDGRLAIDLTVTTGEHKGDVVSISGPHDADPVALTGLPCTLVVEDGLPRIEE